jgi:hypothetical protein
MKRTKYAVYYGPEADTARFSSLRHAMLFAIARSEEFPGHLIEINAKDGLAGQYQGGKPTAEFESHHIAGIFH